MERYTHGHAPSVVAAHGTRTARDSAAYLLSQLRRGQHVLDVGCGPGSITLDLAELVEPGEVVGVDRSDSVVETARAAALARRITNARFEVADAYHLPYGDGAFDVVHAHQVLQHLGDPVAALRQMARVCRPGGIVAARDADYAAFTWFPEDDGLRLWNDVHHAIARANGAEPDAGRRLLSWAHEAGLDQVEAGASTWCYAKPEQRTWWSTTWVARSQTDEFRSQAMELGIDEAELEAITAAWRRFGDHPDGWFLIPHGEIIATVMRDPVSVGASA